jgi:hypothetical protein
MMDEPTRPSEPEETVAPGRSPARPRSVALKAVGFGAGSGAAVALGSFALGALAMGAVAIGTLAIGRLAIGRLRLKEARIDKLRIGSIEVD